MALINLSLLKALFTLIIVDNTEHSQFKSLLAKITLIGNKSNYKHSLQPSPRIFCAHTDNSLCFPFSANLFLKRNQCSIVLQRIRDVIT